jgi:putative acetyltransferase
VAESVSIRPELPGDREAVDGVVRGAFARHPDEVSLLVERIRASAHYVPELALVAEDESGVIAHVLLSFVQIEGGSRPELLNLSPMSVRPDRQRAGVGSRLIRDALGRAEDAGEPAVLVEGIPAYYPRFGFERASPLGFVPPYASIPDDAFMVRRLPGYEPALAGRVAYPPAFDHLAS